MKMAEEETGGVMAGNCRKVLVITCSRTGTASRCLPWILKANTASSVLVLVAHGAGTRRIRLLKRKILKICKIGILGALNGVRMRKWYVNPAEDIFSLCEKLDIPCEMISGLNSEAMARRIREFSPDIGVSLGNGYISPRIFSLPKLGMINLHTEILPAYKNAQAIVWPIYKDDPHTGFTIHEIAQEIDAGRILLQKRIPIEFCANLEDTVRVNKCRVDSMYPEYISYVIDHIEELKAAAAEQLPGGHYTTPSYWQYLRMVWNNRKFYRRSSIESVTR